MRPHRGVRRWLTLLAGALAVLAVGGQAAAVAADAPGAPGKAATWAPGDKDGFGTSLGVASTVWYTLNDGALTGVFFPRCWSISALCRVMR
jgi:glucoamylase